MFDSQSLRYSLRESSTIPKFAYKLALSTTGHTPPNFLGVAEFPTFLSSSGKKRNPGVYLFLQLLTGY